MTTSSVHPVDEFLPPPKLFALGLQHVLVMYAGAVAVPLIVGRALKLDPADVAFLISADLFVCGIATLIQSLGATQWFGIKLPVMMGVTFAAVGPMVAMANANGGPEGARGIFGAIIAAGIISMLIAPLVSRMLRFFPPVVTGTIILVIGVSLMRIGINWIFGNPVGPTAPMMVDPAHAEWLKAAGEGAVAAGLPEMPAKLAAAATVPNPAYAPLGNIAVSAVVLLSILMIARFARGFIANISVLLGIVIGAVIAVAIGAMNFSKVGEAAWFGLITPFHFGMPTFDPVMILTMTLVMIVVMIESTGMFLALGDMTGKQVDQKMLSAGLRTDGLGTLIGGIFNTFPYTSFRQNVFCLRGRRYHPDRAGPCAEDGGACRKRADDGAGRGRDCYVRDGRGDRYPDPLGREFLEQSQQPLRRGGQPRHGDDPAGCAELQAMDAPRPASADRKRHPARLDRGRRPERLLQWCQGQRRRCEGCGFGCRSLIADTECRPRPCRRGRFPVRCAHDRRYPPWLQPEHCPA